MVITLNNGRNELIFNDEDFLRLVDEMMGMDARKWLETWMAGGDDVVAYAESLEHDLQAARERYKEVMTQLRQQAEIIAGLIREKEIDRKALSHAAGEIGVLTWRELNRG